MRILVIGGRGFLGTRVCRVLESMPNAVVQVGTRRPRNADEVEIDLARPASFDVMKRFDFVIDCADTTDTSPIPALDYCLVHGLTFLEPSADADVSEGILKSKRANRAGPQPAGPGRVVLGLGIFPGLSNLLARELVTPGASPESLEVGIQLSPFSGAGGAMCALIGKFLTTDTFRYVNGVRVEDAPLRPTTRLTFASDPVRALCAPFPETMMLHWSTGAPNTATYLALVPPYLSSMAEAMSSVLSPSMPGRPILSQLIRAGCIGVRGHLLRKVETPVDLVAVRDRTDGVNGRVAGLHANDGMLAAACTIAAACDLIDSRETERSGVYLPEELFELEDVLASIRRMEVEGLSISRHSS